MSLASLDLGLGRWLLCVGLGGLLGLDAVSWPQAMVSRPLVSGTLGGLVFGDPVAGLLVGAVLEVVALRHPPYGAARYPDTGPAGLVAGGAFAGSGGAALGPLLAAVLAGWMVGWVGSRSVQGLRAINGRLMGDPAELAVAPGRLVRRHRTAMRLDAVRGALVTSAFLLPALLVARLAAGFGPAEAPALAAALAVAGLGAAAGAGARGLGVGRRSLGLFLAGALLAAVGLTAGLVR